MAVVWITYAWDDNKNKDVDFIAQELRRVGLTVNLDRWNVDAGLDLWKQIQRFIESMKCDAWILYATQNSLGSPPCMKEYLYARDRALSSRGEDFPIIALFPSRPDEGLLSPEIRSRLYVSQTDPDWKERIVSSAKGRGPMISREEISPYEVRIHRLELGQYAIEFRPRGGTWSPFVIGIPVAEKDIVNPMMSYGPSGSPLVKSGPISYTAGFLQMHMKWSDSEWSYNSATNEATPTQSYFLFCKELPSSLLFGGNQNPSQYHLRRENSGYKPVA